MTTTDDNATSWRDLAAQLAGIEAAFDDQPCCEMTTLAGPRCQRSARWRVNLHGCEQANMCGQHKRAWLKRQVANRLLGRPWCGMCRIEFDSFDDAVRITAI
ncbi:MAG: hypothetical protein WBZ37_18300 [Mycobacterium sp.]